MYAFLPARIRRGTFFRLKTSCQTRRGKAILTLCASSVLMRGVPEKEVRSLRTALLIEPVQRCAVIRFAQAKRRTSPDRPFDGSGSFWCMFRSPDFHRITLKTKRIICSIMIVLTLRYAFKAFPLFAGKFQPFEFKTDFSVFSALILSSPVFKVTTR